MGSNKLNTCASWGPLALRVITGLIFVIAGFGKLTAISGFAGALAASGYPAATFLAWLVALIELIAGAMLVLGIYTRKAAMPLKIILIFAVITKLLGGFGGASWGGIQLDLLLIAALMTLIHYGPGRWAAMDCCASSCCMMEEKPAAKAASKKAPAKKASAKKPAAKKASSAKKKTTKKAKK